MGFNSGFKGLMNIYDIVPDLGVLTNELEWERCVASRGYYFEGDST